MGSDAMGEQWMIEACALLERLRGYVVSDLRSQAQRLDAEFLTDGNGATDLKEIARLLVSCPARRAPEVRSLRAAASARDRIRV